MGYVSLHLCSITQGLIPNELVELSNEGCKEANGTCTCACLNVPNNCCCQVTNGMERQATETSFLTIQFPAGSQQAAIFQYSPLYIATVKLINIDDTHIMCMSLHTL